MRVVELWRFPVKSLLGERLDSAAMGAEGIAGDRGWALFDVDTGFGLTARRVPELLFAAGRLRGDGGVEVVLPDGTVTRDDAVLSRWAGRRVTLRSAAEETGTLGAWDPRRFRANVLLDGAGEDGWVGRSAALGTAELEVVRHVPRCVMVTRPQAGGIGRDTGVLKTLHRERHGLLAVGALVTRPGRLSVGDQLLRR